jgi:HlyD family secretion protein
MNATMTGQNNWTLPNLTNHFEAWWLLATVAVLALFVLGYRRTLKRRAAKLQADTDDTARPHTADRPALQPLPDDVDVPDGISGYLAFGTVLSLLLIGGGGGWAALTEIAGAVLAPGTVVVESKVKKVQHPTGGIVGEIRVEDGDAVKAGDLLVRLDDTTTRANLVAITKQLDELAVRQARLLSEQVGSATLRFPKSIMDRLQDPTIGNITSSEQTLFESRTAARDGQKSQLLERVAQLTSETDGLETQIAAKAEQIALADDELSRIQPLEKVRLVPSTKMTGARRDLSALRGEHAQLMSTQAQVKDKIAETRLQILQIDQELRSEVGKELRESQGKEAELIERKITAEDQLKRVEIRAPQTGIVHQLTAHTVGGVVGPGEPIMLIVPEDDKLVIEAKISPADIDHVHTSQEAFVRFPAFNQRTTPEFTGTVQVISADLSHDTGQSQQGPPYYLVRVVLSARERARLGALKLLPGMPAEVHIATPSRTALSYIVKPITDQIALAFKER